MFTPTMFSRRRIKAVPNWHAYVCTYGFMHATDASSLCAMHVVYEVYAMRAISPMYIISGMDHNSTLHYAMWPDVTWRDVGWVRSGG